MNPDDELQREIDAHLELEAEEHMEQGMSPLEARHAARRAFGNPTRIKEAVYEVRAWIWWETLVQDLRYAARSMRKTPGFAVVVVVCLAFGIGATTAIFTLLDAALLRALPVADPEHLVGVQSLDPRGRGGSSFSYPQFAYMREHASVEAELFAYAPTDVNLSAGELTDTPESLLVSDNYFSVLGVNLAIGRALVPADETVVVVSYRFWQTRFHGDPAIAGRAIVLNGLPFTVIGVTPRRFFGVEVGRSPDLFIPLVVADRLTPGVPRSARPNAFWLNVMARLRPGMSASRAAADLDVVYHQGVSVQAPGMRPNLASFLQQRRVVVVPGARGMHSIGEQFGAPLLTLMAVVCLVLLIACVDVASLMLARATARRREIAVRLALGAGRRRLLRQMFTESLVLSAAGGVVGLLLAGWSARALTGFFTNRFLDVSPDARVLGFTIAASILTALFFGTAPALRATRTDLTAAFKGESSPDAPGRGARFGRLLVSGQVAMSLLLLMGAGLFLRTFGNLRAMDAGFRGDHVLLATLNPGLNRYTPEQSRAFYAELLKRMASLPGVHSVSLADAPLLSGAYIDGFSAEGSDQPAATSLRIVAPRFFETMGITIRLGRDFSVDDRSGSPKVGIINETIARTFFAGTNPIGRHVGLGAGPDMEIVGVIADTKYRTLRESIPNTLYLPMEQAQSGAERTLHVRTDIDPSGLAGAVREHVRALDKNLPVKVQLFSHLVDEDLARERLIATLSGFFGVLALMLTSIGLYGVIAYSVERRTREIGIRMSLGARRPTVVWMVLRDCLWLVGLGVAAGVPASLWLSRLVPNQLFGVAPTDPVTMASAAAFLAGAGALAGYAPARRASRVDPTIALRHD